MLDKVKERYDNLSLTVYEKNTKAINFYHRRGFITQYQQLDANTNDKVKSIDIGTIQHVKNQDIQIFNSKMKETKSEDQLK